MPNRQEQRTAVGMQRKNCMKLVLNRCVYFLYQCFFLFDRGHPVVLILTNNIYSIFRQTQLVYTGCLKMNGAVSKVDKKFISHLTRAKRTPLAAATVQVSHALPAFRSLVLTAGLRGQFPRWRRSRKRLSVCSVLRCPDL